MNVPKLRFKEFNDEWKKTTLQNLTFIIDGDRGKNYPKENEFYNREYCLFLNAGNVTKNGFDFSNNTFITKEKDGILRNGKLLKEDIVLTTRGTVGNVAYYDENIPYQNIRINSGMVIIRINNNNICSKYLYSYMKSPQFSLQVTRSNFGSAQPQLTVKGLSRFTISYPLIKEQEKLSFFINLLDKKIELQSKKIEALKLYKKSISNTFFNNKNLKPFILKKVCSIKKGQQLNNEYLNNSGKYYMLNGGIYPSGYTNNYNTIENTISISEGGNSCGYVNYNKEKFWSGGHCYTITPININNEYLFQLLKYSEKKIMSLRVGSGLPNIQKKDLESFKINIHNKEKQIVISKILSTIDNRILLEEKKLNTLSTLKKGFMQKMFI